MELVHIQTQLQMILSSQVLNKARQVQSKRENNLMGNIIDIHYSNLN